MANKANAERPDVFQRLMGLETEYALHISAPQRQAGVSRYAIYQRVVAALRSNIPTVAARHLREGVFHAAGGAVWFDAEWMAFGGGLIEGATPECRSPRDLLAAQRAQDSLLVDAVQQSFGASVSLLKNDRDGEGNIYGAQENYSAQFAVGWRLGLWRIALVALFPLALVTWLGLWLISGAVFGYSLAATFYYLAVERWLARPEKVARRLFGCRFDELGQGTSAGPKWLELLISYSHDLVCAPLAAGLYLALWATAFVRIRRELTPFLLSRAIYCGAGMLDDAGRFHLADKAPAMNCLTGYGGLLKDRPIFTFGHFYKKMIADSWLNPREYLALFAGQQRLQIALGDSNIAEMSEYLRVGATALVLDCIEAGEMPPVPRVHRPIQSLRRICADSTLKAEVKLAAGRRGTALQLQFFYLDACRKFLARRPQAPAEARETLRRWEAVLRALERDPQSLVGTLDWVTKKWLLNKAGRGASWAVRKKIDLKYHELSAAGYFERLKATGVVHLVLKPDEIAHARRNPPANSPSAVRGRYIREFAGGDEPVTANWQAVFIGAGRSQKVIRLADYRPTTISEPPTKDKRAPKR